jgi:hypothetical protein
MKPLSCLNLAKLLLILTGLQGPSSGSRKVVNRPKFIVGRIPPGQFEYSELNGFYGGHEAAGVCERATACAGFTYKGTPSTRCRLHESFWPKSFLTSI